jgi:hypothetical protein
MLGSEAHHKPLKFATLTTAGHELLAVLVTLLVLESV